MAERITVDGNEAVASVAHRTNEIIVLYPITPSSPMGEWCDDWSAKGEKNIWGAIPDVTDTIAAGEFSPLLGWLKERIHSKGSLLTTAELVESATGRPLATASFERHLRDRYLA